MLPTYVGFSSPTEAQGCAAEDNGGVARSGGVADNPEVVWSQSEAHLHTLEGFRIFGWLSSFFPFFYYVALWVLVALPGGSWELGDCWRFWRISGTLWRSQLGALDVRECVKGLSSVCLSSPILCVMSVREEWVLGRCAPRVVDHRGGRTWWSGGMVVAGWSWGDGGCRV